nr:uncharacterized protein LOC124817781 [Hydra vulgaris]
MATANIDQEIKRALNQNEELLGITPSLRSPHGGVSRKRKADRSSWKQSVREIQRQSGKAYKNTKGEQIPKRSIVALKSCRNCKFKCSTNISEIERQTLFDNFWTLDDDGKKNISILKLLKIWRKNAVGQLLVTIQEEKHLIIIAFLFLIHNIEFVNHIIFQH